MAQRSFQRGNPDGFRLQFGGMNTVNPPDQMPQNKYPYAQNVRSYVRQRVGPRAAQDAAVLVASASVHSIRRLNDSTLAAGGGEGNSSGSFSFSPAILNFGSVPQNTLAQELIEITFTGTGSATLYSVSLSNSSFQLVAATMPTLPYTFNPGGFTGWYVGINQPAGNYSAVMTVVTSVGTYTINVTATAVAGNVTISPSSLHFPSTPVGSTSAPQTITVTNSEPVAVELGGYTFTSAPFTPSTDFAFSPVPPFPQTIAAGQSLTFSIVATPHAGGTGQATLTILTNLAGVQATCSLTMAATFLLSPTSLAFGTVPQNTLVELLIELLFYGTGPATLNSVSLSNASFVLSNLPTLPYTFNAGGSFVGWYVELNQPTGSYSAVMTIVTSLGTYTVNVTATTVPQTVVVSPTSLTFPNTAVGATSVQQAIVITNNEPAAVDLGGYSIQSAPFTPSTDFALVGAIFPMTIAAGQSLTYFVAATPTATGSRTATLTILTSIPGFQMTVTLAVIATAAALSGIEPVQPQPQPHAAVGPPYGYVLIAGSGPNLWMTDVASPATEIDTNYSSNPLSLLPFRPNASPQPWMYIGDLGKMTKVRSDGTVYRVGIQEPQVAPKTEIIPASDVLSTVGPITVTYWGDSPHSGPVGNYIWKHASDTNAYGPVRATTPASGATTGNSLIFDVPEFAGTPTPSGFAAPGSPMLWFQYDTYNGIVTTGTDANGPFAEWDSGDQFGGLVAGDAIIIGGVSFVIAANPTPNNTRVYLTTSAGTQQNINYSAAIVGGPSNLFVPPLESEGYSDFNFSLTGVFYVPAAGAYTFYWQSKDESLFGIGNSGVGQATWPPASAHPGSQLSLEGQSVTSINGYPLMPKTVVYDGGGQYNHGGGYIGGTTPDNAYSGVTVNFSQPGNYPFEINFNYWYHSGRILHVECVGPTQAQGPDAFDIPPLPLDVITNASYRSTYRSSATGATSNPSPESPQQNFSVLSTKVTPTPSTDPQVDKIDIYRMDSGLLSFTYVGTIANIPSAAQSFNDQLLDTDVSGNPILQFDNFEPFPSIDLPRSGTVNVQANGVVVWEAGDQFNVRWLPGTIILVGTIAFTLNTRPTSTAQLTCSNVDVVQGVEQVVYPNPGTVPYAIQEPILAAQRLPYLWGPTDNVAFFFACGDPLRPGVLYWSKGNQPDSAPDTNQQDVTAPTEPLMNGCITNGLGMVFSTERAWIIIPNFFNSQATVEGNTGSTWTLQETISNRGLYMPWCLAVDGGGNVYFRAKDGVYVSPSGQGSQSITDPDLFNLFPHEGVDRKLTPITIGVAPNAYTVYPPDDSQPAYQNMHFANGYLYYDYRDASSTPRTLVFDVAAGGWVVDVYANPVRTHVLEEGVVNGTLVGSENGQVQPLTGTGAEIATAVLLMPSFNAGDVRADKQWGDLYVEAEAGSVK